MAVMASSAGFAVVLVVLLLLCVLCALVARSMKTAGTPRVSGGAGSPTAEGKVEAHSPEFYERRAMSADQLASRDWSEFARVVRPLVYLPYEVTGEARIEPSVKSKSNIRVGEAASVTPKIRFKDLSYHTHPAGLRQEDKHGPLPAKPSGQDLAIARVHEGQGFTPWHGVAAVEGVYVYRTDDETFKTSPLIEAAYKAMHGDKDEASKLVMQELRLALTSSMEAAFQAKYVAGDYNATPEGALEVMREHGYEVALIPWE